MSPNIVFLVDSSNDIQYTKVPQLFFFCREGVADCPLILSRLSGMSMHL